MNRQKREQQILDASLRVFARLGYENTSVSGLVKEAQVSRGTFYLYFKSKSEIFDCLIDRFMGEILHFGSLFDPVQIQQSKVQLSNLSHDLATCLTKYRLLARVLMVNSRGLTPGHRLKIDGYLKQAYRVLEYNIQNAIRMGEVVHSDASVLARCLVGTLKEFVLEWSSDNESYNLEAKIAEFFGFMMQALIAPMNSSYMTDESSLDRDSYLKNDLSKSTYI